MLFKNINEMKILIFIETDVVVRHFIFSDAFKKLQNSHDVVFVFPDGDKRLGAIRPANLNLNGCRRLKLEPYIKRLKLWRIRFFVEKLRYKKGISINVIRQWRKDFKDGNPIYAFFLYRLFGMPLIFKVFTIIVNILISRNQNYGMLEILSKEKPDLLIHPSVLEGSYIDDVVFYGNKMKKDIIIIMNSWDNPLTKRSVVNKDYNLLVWGKQTKEHALQYMGLKEDKVIEFGSAQFDIYYEKNNDEQDSTSIKKNLKSNLKTLLYAGSSKYADEFSHLLKIDNAISDGLLPKLKVIYRPHPWGGCGYEGHRFKNYKFKNVIYDKNMISYISRDFETDYSKFLPDMKLTKNLLESVDIVLSPLSTILLEAMILGKIPICLMTEDEKQAKHFHMVKGSPHFEEILSNKNIIVLNGKNFLIKGIAKALKNSLSDIISEELKKDSEFFITKFSKPYNQRLLEFADKLFLKSNF